jgi:hypothetical protein
MGFVVVVAHWRVPDIAHPSAHECAFDLRSFCVKQQDA